MPETINSGGHGKIKKANLESAIQNKYGKAVSVEKEVRVVHGGATACVIVWIKRNGKEIILRECYKNDDTDMVEVQLDGVVKKTFYQGSYGVGKPGTVDDYFGNNAFIEAETYAMGLI